MNSPRPVSLQLDFLHWCKVSSAPDTSPFSGWNATLSDGANLLHVIANCELFEGVGVHASYLRTQWALQAGVNPYAQRSEVGDTPLHTCVWSYAYGTAMALLEYNPKLLTVHNRNSLTPKELLIHQSSILKSNNKNEAVLESMRRLFLSIEEQGILKNALTQTSIDTTNSPHAFPANLPESLRL